jgi:hypothetical protein
MAAKRKPVQSVKFARADVAREHLEALSIGKQGYKAADAALELLITQCRTDNCPECGGPRFKNNGIVKTGDGRAFRIVDKFASKNTTNVGQNVRRFEIEEIGAL